MLGNVGYNIPAVADGLLPLFWYQTGEADPLYEYRCFLGSAGSKPTAVVSPSVKFTRVENPTASTCFTLSATDQDARLQSTGVDSVEEILTSMPLSDATPPELSEAFCCCCWCCDCCWCCSCCRFSMLFGRLLPLSVISSSVVGHSLPLFPPFWFPVPLICKTTSLCTSSPKRYSGSPWLLFSGGRLYLKRTHTRNIIM